MSAKHTQGPVTIDGKDAALYWQAFNVAHETGMTPRQLANERCHMLSLVSKANDRISQTEAQRNELLAALEKIANTNGGGTTDRNVAMKNIARAAVAKVKPNERQD